MKSFLVDVPVLILFFNRPKALVQVFEQVKKARPSKLFLYQDGARNDNDKEGIDECRRIVDDIDWDCEVHKNYQKINSGCDPSNYNAHKWAFSIVDKCIVFEDDSVPSVSFFKFCKEMLDRYEDDQRIAMITGLNHEGITEGIPYDYLFSSVFSIWGWASWKRVIDKWDGQYKFLDDNYSMQQMKAVFKQRGYRNVFFDIAYKHKSQGIPFYETIFQAEMVLNSQLSIIPTKNMIHNLGPDGGDSTHYGKSLDLLPKASRRIFTMPTYDITTPIKHPEYVIEDINYGLRVYRILGWGHPWIKIMRSLEELFLNLKHGDFKNILKSLVNRIKKMAGRKEYK